jgi:hypothetical protein
MEAKRVASSSNYQNNDVGASTIVPGTTFSDLGPDLGHRIFSLLGGSPRNIAPAAAVCKEWRSILETITWREMCLKAARGLCGALGYDYVNTPPGGWMGCFKMLVYCPGLDPPLSYVLENDDELLDINRTKDWWQFFGHVENTAGGFVTGGEVHEALHLRGRFRDDEIYASQVCFHDIDDLEKWDPHGECEPRSQKCMAHAAL